jgi:SAM-dependent methyltransferase
MRQDGRSTRSSSERLAREIAHHRKIAPNAEAIWSWTSPAGRARAARRARFFVDHGELEQGRRSLELGCGTGIFLEQVATSGACSHGLDLSAELLEQARSRVAHLDNVRLTRGNAEALPYADATFDAAYGSSVLHHLDLDATLRELWRVLRPGGRLVFAEPNALNPQLLLIFHVGAVKERFGVSPDEMAFTRFRARSALERAGFVDISVEPHDFLHPSTPESLLSVVGRVSRVLERLPVVREIAGSLLIRARRDPTSATH